VPGPCRPALQRAAIGSSAWAPPIGQLAAPGRSGAAQIVASGPTLLLALFGSQAGPVSAQAVVYRSAGSGGTWQQRTDPCSGRGTGGRSEEEDLTDLAGARRAGRPVRAFAWRGAGGAGVWPAGLGAGQWWAIQGRSWWLRNALIEPTDWLAAVLASLVR